MSNGICLYQNKNEAMHTLKIKQRRRQKEHEKDENCFVFSFGAVEMSQGLQVAGLQHSNLESSAK